MNIYLLSQGINTSWDTYDSVVVIAATELEARHICPCSWDDRSWANSPDEVQVELIGMAKEGSEVGIVCSSFNAG